MIVRPRILPTAKCPQSLHALHPSTITHSSLETATPEYTCIPVPQYATMHSCIVLVMRHYKSAPCKELIRILAFLKFTSDLKAIYHDALNHNAPIRFTRNERIRSNYLLHPDHVKLLVVCPGPIHKVIRMASKLIHSLHESTSAPIEQLTTWIQFIPDERFISALGLWQIPEIPDQTDTKQSWPCILSIRPDLTFQTILIGNGPGFYGHLELLHHLKLERERKEQIVSELITFSRQLVWIFDQQLAMMDYILSPTATRFNMTLSTALIKKHNVPAIPVEVFWRMIDFMDIPTQRIFGTVSTDFSSILLSYHKQILVKNIRTTGLFLNERVTEGALEGRLTNIDKYTLKLQEMLSRIYSLVKSSSSNDQMYANFTREMNQCCKQLKGMQWLLTDRIYVPDYDDALVLYS